MSYNNIPFLDTDNSAPCSCFTNVEKQVAEHGGNAVYGWLVEETEPAKGKLRQLTQHALWEDEAAYGYRAGQRSRCGVLPDTARSARTGTWRRTFDADPGERWRTVFPV
jgi:hypothetical protein